MKCRACGCVVGGPRPRCPKCGQWNSVGAWASLASVQAGEVTRLATGIEALDQVLGGGFVRGKTYRLSGRPGCGKSTLALLLAAQCRGLYLTTEETEAGIRLRAERLQVADRDLPIGEVRAVEEVENLPDGLELLVFDSINEAQTLAIAGGMGSNDQLVHAIRRLKEIGAANGAVVLAISQVNAEGQAAGTTAASHIPDATLEMDFTDADEWGVFVVTKHRYGPRGRIFYRHTENGLEFKAEQQEGDQNS